MQAGTPLPQGLLHARVEHHSVVFGVPRLLTERPDLFKRDIPTFRDCRQTVVTVCRAVINLRMILLLCEYSHRLCSPLQKAQIVHYDGQDGCTAPAVSGCFWLYRVTQLTGDVQGTPDDQSKL